MEFIGYLNRRLYTDIESWVLEQDEKGRFFATPVKKDIDLRDCPFEQGGFCGHFYGTKEAFRDAKPYKCGTPFEVRQDSNGYWYAKCVIPTTFITAVTIEDAEKYRRQYIEKGIPEAAVSVQPVFSKQGTETESYSVRVLQTTPTGRVKHRKEIFGKVEKTCRFYYDYNF